MKVDTHTSNATISAYGSVVLKPKAGPSGSVAADRRRQSVKRAVSMIFACGCAGAAVSTKPVRARLASAAPSFDAAAATGTPGTDYSFDLSACANYDDDSVANYSYGVICAYNDYAAWCSDADATGAGTGFHSVCSKACDGGTASDFAMVCAWEAISHLPEVCNQTFNATSPVGMGHDAPAETAVDKAALDLYSCDEHAFCLSCSGGNKHCAAVAAQYGNIGVPYADDVVDYRMVDGKIGANSAMVALNDDLSFWCDAATLASIADDTFVARSIF